MENVNENDFEKLHSKSTKGKYKNTNYYVCGKELREELRMFAESDYSNYTVRLCEMLKLMCERYSLRPNLIGYTYRDEMIEDAFLRCLQQIHHIKLDHENCNPFAYVSKIIEHSMIARIKKEKRQHEIKERLAETIFDEMNLDVNYDYNKDGNSD